MQIDEEIACSFRLEEPSTSHYAILLEPREQNLTVLGAGCLMLRLRSGMTFGQAEQITKFLQENIRGVSYTSSRSAP
ncbi:MAG: hypothetical protein HYX74_05645 [Acidobacteria bacterium]|nr:hypothetical protein [Acidobacteriota bacterium]